MPRRGERRGAQRRAKLNTGQATGGWFHRPDGKVRAGWRFLVFLLVAIVAVLLATALLASFGSIASAFGFRVVVYPLAVPLGLIAAHVFVVRVFESGSWAYVRLDGRAARRELVASGGLFGAAAIGLPALALLAAGYLAVVAAPPGSSLMAAAYMAWILVPAALGEELLARGYVFALLRESWGWQPALIVTSAAFGLLHLANPGSNPQAILNVVLAGFFLGLVLIRFASLYAAWAAHAAWNLVLAAVLHTDVSGLGIGPTPDYRVIDSGPDWLTGGAWGPEGGAAAALGLAVASVILLRPLLRDARAAAAAAQQTNETDNAT